MEVFKFSYVDSGLSADALAALRPTRQSELASGFDLVASHDAVIAPSQRGLIATGICIELTKGFEGQVRSRSGLALKHGIMVLNAPGTIDADYRGEIKVILANLSQEPFVIKFGMRIAQLVIAPVVLPQLILSEGLEPTKRQEGGFGSTGTGAHL